ncbi:hypothetical protein [Streptomyces sp. NPDC085540]
MTTEQRGHFDRLHAQLLARDALLLVWLLDGADALTVEKVLAPLPATA